MKCYSLSWSFDISQPRLKGVRSLEGFALELTRPLRPKGFLLPRSPASGSRWKVKRRVHSGGSGYFEGCWVCGEKMPAGRVCPGTRGVREALPLPAAGAPWRGAPGPPASPFQGAALTRRFVLLIVLRSLLCGSQNLKGWKVAVTGPCSCSWLLTGDNFAACAVCDSCLIGHSPPVASLPPPASPLTNGGGL